MHHVDIFAALLAYLVFVFSTTCHEAAHALVALLLGDNTAYLGGQVSLDPVPHIRREPLGMLVVPLAGLLFNGMLIGWASAPYNPLWALRYPKRSAIMAMAGPAANLLLVVASVLLIYAGRAAGVLAIPDLLDFQHIAVAVQGGPWTVVASLLSLLFSLNILLCVLNLIPVPPLDGASIPLLFLSHESSARYMHMQRSMGVFLILIAWVIFNRIFPPAWHAAVHLFFFNGAMN